MAEKSVPADIGRMSFEAALSELEKIVQRLEEGEGRADSDLRQGANDFGNTGYDGPQPPEGDGPHHYHIRLAALDTDHLDVGPRQRAEAVWDAAQGHILEETELVGTYEQ